MSLADRRAARPQPRLVTKAPASPEQAAVVSDRYATDPTRPHPAAQADAMGSTVLAYLITGPVLFGGLGWLLDRALGLTLFVVVGILAGMTLSLYTVWLRYGTSETSPAGHSSHPPLGSLSRNEEIQ